jgi:DNA-directed RNA polymerase subunit M/transcription elongation factor TFIIS
MKFCNICANMLYVSTNADKKLIHHCNMCGTTEVADTSLSSVCVIDDNKVDDAILYKQYLTTNIKYDPSLPRVNNIECPNTECIKDKEAEPETIYLKYDFMNMKYLYYCCHCEHFWRTV